MGYLGSKAASGVYQKIIANMPPHDTYIETHLGGGAIMLRKPPAETNIGIDVDVLQLGVFAISNHLPSVRLIHHDAVAFLESFDFSSAGRVLIYADPPYLPETRTGNARYRHEYTANDHRRLIACLRSLPAAVMLSGYPSALYRELLPDWRSITFQAMTRGGVRTEQLWMNFPEGKPFTAAYAGKDYIDRQRIKRKVERWRKKYQALPPAERLAIMQALSNIDD
ncbi:DNA adenine methylase [Serratia marcescens]|uniref:site-specific DNA-methyltransferase (adenine-specific) n=1 Tax=Serratia marcescens TaxID=615 RepID=A0A5C7CDZ6_SERMA|nr:DNA adenine methylase [Serratia marcescens]TXE33234.1 DNA adenine methylase [Serratia marcescens]TXE65242.1 DNA adenine methylase [Serratia marcescens]